MAKKKRNYLLISLGGLAALIIITFISIEITSQPSFCKTCHYMEPYYQSWKQSVHSDVKCTQCHFPPGLAGTIRGKLEGLVQVVNYISSSYSRRKPWAEIEDASCLRSGCHETQKLNTDVVYKGVHFNHKKHLNNMRRGKKLRCTSCHSQIVQGEHIKVTETTCFLCHFKESEFRTKNFIKKVSDCHNCHKWENFTKEERAKFKFDHTMVINNKIECKRCHIDTIVGDGYVPKENCYNCHWDIERLGLYDELDLIHTTHIEKHKVECTQCHLPIQHKLTKLDPEKDLACGTCHEDMHHEQKALFTGQKIDGIKGDANPMYLVGLECASCHIFHDEIAKDSGVMRANPKSCETCHGKGYGRLLNMWKEATAEKMSELNSNLRTTKNLLRGKNKKIIQLTKENIANTERILHVLKEGKAIHNTRYSSELMNQGNKYLNSALKIMNAGITFEYDSSSSQLVSECRNCHIGIEDITVKHNNKLFRHGRHLKLKGVDCQTCHTNKSRHGELKLSDSQCASCHHKAPEKLDCKTCHKIEFEIQSGNFMEIREADIMFDAEISCTDCHQPNDKIEKPGKEFCADCHDEEYNTTKDEWIKNYSSLVSEVQNKFDKLGLIYRKEFPKKILTLRNKFNLIQKFSAKSLHNHFLIIQALDQINETLKEYFIGE